MFVIEISRNVKQIALSSERIDLLLSNNSP